MDQPEAGGAYTGTLNQVIEALADPFSVVDVATYRVLVANSAARRGRDLASGTTCHLLSHLSPAPCTGEHPCPLALVVQTRRPVTVEHIHFDASGRPRNVEVRGHPIFSPAGDVVQMVEHCIDITDRKAAEVAMQAALAARQAIIDTAATAVYTVDSEQRFLETNFAFDRITGYEAAEVRGLPCSILKWQPCDASCPLHAQVGAVCVHRQRCTLRTKDGRTLTVLKNFSASFDDQGRSTGGVESFVDITELTDAVDAALAASRAKSAFLATMSHEIRTPMNGIVGMTGLLLDSALTPEQREYAETVRMCSDSLLGLINDILDFSKVEAGKVELETIDFDLRVALDETADIIAVRTAQKGLELSVDVAPEVPSRLRGDPGRLRQVLLNLISNAVKFTERGSVVVEVRLEAEEAERATVRFEVRDTGIGMPPEHLGRLFEAFVQADASTTRRFGGTGLGLAISKRLVQLMDGTIGARSEVGQGSTFWFVVPFARQVGTPAPVADEAVELRGQRVLVVDDLEVNRRILKRLLEGWGCLPGEAADADEALVALRAAVDAGTPYAVALLDFDMPGRNGEALAQAIKADPALAGVRLALMTSVPRPGAGARLREAGFAAYLVKPLRRHLIHQCLRTVLADAASVRPTPDRLITDNVLHEARKERVRILVADDNAVNRMVALKVLDRLGYRADAVVDGHEALRALETTPYDLVLMDVEMPGMDGMEAVHAIRTDPRFQGVRDVPVIALTAHVLEEERKRILTTGMNDFLAKPFTPRELMALMERWLPSSRSVVTGVVSAGSSVGAATVFDRTSLLERVMGDEATAAEVVGVVVEQAARLLADLRAAVATGTTSRLRATAHVLKGVAAAAGARALADHATALERALATTDRAPAEALLGELERDLAAFRSAAASARPGPAS